MMLDEELARIVEICNLKIGDYDPIKANELFNQAEDFRKKEKWDSAEKLIKEALESNPYEFRYWLLYSQCLTSSSRESDEHFEQSHAVFEYTMGRVDFDGMKRFVDNLKYFQELEEKSVDNLQEKKWEEAEKGFRELLDMKNSLPEVFRKTLDKGLEIPKDFMYWNGIAFSTENLGKLEEAEEAYRKSIELNPEEFHTWYFFAGFLSNQGKLQEAEAMYREAVKLEPKHSAAWCDLGACIANQGRITEAEKVYQKAIKLNPKELNTLYYFVEFLSNQGKYKEAEAMIREALKLEPKNSNIWCELGACLVKQGKIEEAEDPLKKALKFDSSNQHARELLKRCLDYLS